MIDKKTNMRTTDESKKVAFRRTENVLRQLKLIGNLSNSYYNLTDGQIREIIKALDAAMREAKDKLQNKSKSQNGARLFTPSNW